MADKESSGNTNRESDNQEMISPASYVILVYVLIISGMVKGKVLGLQCLNEKMMNAYTTRTREAVIMAHKMMTAPPKTKKQNFFVVSMSFA
jgi:hypothetical protein